MTKSDKRGESWLKCKKDYGDLHDSLDLIVRTNNPVSRSSGSCLLMLATPAHRCMARHGKESGMVVPNPLGIIQSRYWRIRRLVQMVGRIRQLHTQATDVQFIPSISGFTDQFYKDLNVNLKLARCSCAPNLTLLFCLQVRYTEGTDTCSKQSLAYVETGCTSSLNFLSARPLTCNPTRFICIAMIPDVWFLPSEVSMGSFPPCFLRSQNGSYLDIGLGDQRCRYHHQSRLSSGKRSHPPRKGAQPPLSTFHQSPGG